MNNEIKQTDFELLNSQLSISTDVEIELKAFLEFVDAPPKLNFIGGVALNIVNAYQIVSNLTQPLPELNFLEEMKKMAELIAENIIKKKGRSTQHLGLFL